MHLNLLNYSKVIFYMKKIVTGLSCLGFGAYLISNTLSEHPNGINVYHSDKFDNSFLCSGVVTEIRSKISNVDVFYFKNQGFGTKTQGFFAEPPFYVSSNKPRIYIRESSFENMNFTCLHESFHAYVKSVNLNLSSLLFIDELRDEIFLNSNLIENLFIDFNFDDISDSGILDKIKYLSTNYDSFSSSDYVLQLTDVFHQLNRLELDEKNTLIRKQLAGIIYRLKYVLTYDELFARLLTSYVYDLSDDSYAVSRSFLESNSLFVEFLSVNKLFFPFTYK